MGKTTMADVLKAARPVERSVTVCVAGDLNVQIEDQERILRDIATDPHRSLAASPEETAAAEQIELLRQQMHDHEVTFTFRALSSRAWSDLMAAHPAREGKEEGFDLDTLPAALLAASCIEPTMTSEDADALANVLNNAQFGQLFDTAWRCSNRELDVPFSALASRVLRDSGVS